MSAHSTNVRRYGDIICTLPYPGNHQHIGSHWPSLLLSTTAQYSCSVGETLLKCLVKSPALAHGGSRFGVTVANLSPLHTFHSVKGILRSCLLYHYFCQVTNSNVGHPQALCARDLWKGKPPFLSVLVQTQTTQDLLNPLCLVYTSSLFLCQLPRL